MKLKNLNGSLVLLLSIFASFNASVSSAQTILTDESDDSPAAATQQTELTEQERMAQERQQAERRRLSEEQAAANEVAATNERSRVASYGPNAPQEPGMRLSSSIGVGSQHTGAGINGFSMPLAARLAYNNGRNHLDATARTGIADSFSLQSAARYTRDFGNPQVIVGTANSDRIQGQPQFVGQGALTLGLGPSGTYPFNSLIAGAGVGYNFSGRARALYMQNPAGLATPVVRGMIRPRATFSAGVGSQAAASAQGFAGLGLGVDAQVEIPVASAGSHYYITAELGGGVERGLNFVDSDNNLVIGEGNLQGCLRPRTGQQNFRGGCVGFQGASQQLGNNSGSFFGFTGSLDWDFMPNGSRRVASDAPRSAADRPVENHTPHPAGENSASGSGAVAE